MPDIYEFHICGTVGELVRSALPELTANTDPTHSLLLGPAPDDAAVTRVVDELVRQDIVIASIRINRSAWHTT